MTEQLDQVDPVASAAGPIMGDPGPSGRFGEFGGRFVPESLVPACMELEAAFRSAWADPAFHTELDGDPPPTTAAGPRR